MKLGDRMKAYYENINRYYLTRRTPVVIRIDGKAFHTFTRGFKKPFDNILMSTMQETMKRLCEDIQGCVLGYTQSDEISLVLIDYQTIDTDAWFGYNIQKCASIAASKATKYFNQIFTAKIMAYEEDFNEAWHHSKDEEKYMQVLLKAMNTGAEFDARVFNIPKEEVANYIFWRQDDATRNSIQMAGHANFSNKEMQKKSNNEVQDMLMLQKGINWNDYPVPCKRGTCCIKQDTEIISNGQTVIRKKWVIDKNIPIFTGENRTYIENLI